MSIQTRTPKLVLMHVLQGVIKLQKVRRESVLALAELG